MEFTEKSRLPGPNRRSERSILEYGLKFRPGFTELPPANDEALRQGIETWLVRSGCGESGPFFFEPGGAGNWPLQVSRYVAQLALLLQQAAGHRVEEWDVLPDSEDPLFWVWFEYDHSEVGERAAALAMAVIRKLLGLDEPETAEESRERVREFLGFAQGKALSLETRALVAAAARRDIPCFKLDRYPYDPFEGAFRIRPNGLLRLGHARYQYVLDGTLCVNWNPAQVARLQQRHRMLDLLRAAGVAVATDADGGRLRLLVVGGNCVAALRENAIIDLAGISVETLQQVAAVHRHCALPIFAATLTDAGAWVLLDPTPSLEDWFPAGGEQLDAAADLLLAQLYPPGSPCRIPIVSVTGTNGKTTTCTMIRHILLQAGNTPVVECSNGIFVGHKPQGSRREIGPASTWFALESTAADVAVFEDYFGRIARFGFAYEWSDVAVCTNVTVDHLHNLGVHTLEQMAEVKFAVIARARKGVVLNADNPGCASMLARATADKRFAVSMLRSRDELAAAHHGIEQFCVLEQESGRDSIVLYDAGQRVTLVSVNDIPATLQGTARHNTSNAMHAAAASWIMGVQPAAIAAALRAFVSDFASCRGRLNEFTGLPFRAIMDYAHNGDGFRQVASYIDTQVTSGRKIVMFSYSEDRRKTEIREAVRELAGHFDNYICGKFREPRRIVTEDVPGTLRNALIDFGVDAGSITLAADSAEALELALEQVRPGDLLVLLAGASSFEIIWQRLAAMREAAGQRAEALT